MLKTINQMDRLMNTVTIKKMSELCGYSPYAIQAKISKGQWVINKHFYKAPDDRIFINKKEVEAWIKS
jgi:hypothetical protein